MHVFFEEDGGFKVGTILADNTTSFQVETLHGKRAKIKAGNVLLQFKEPALSGFLEAAQALVDGIDLSFLWEVSGTEEFEHQTLGRDYFGHAPNAVETAGLLLRLHSAPMYFYKKGKGRYKAAPADALKAALASEERKRQQAALLARYIEELRSFHLPPEFATHLPALLYAPEKNAIETKALEQAATACGLSSLHLLAKCGAIPSTHDFHFKRFLREWFPAGPGFNASVDCVAPTDLPLAEVAAFSIDDETTTEIDDAFSLQKLDNGDYCVGIHIAAPALGIVRDTPLEAIARQRLSTVYMPGQKITMLPDSVVEVFTLKQGAACPALSLYLTIAPDFSVRAMESRVEQVTIAANLRHEQLEPLFNAETIGQGSDYPYRTELEGLWQFANHLEVQRGVKDTGRGLIPEYSFKVIEDRVQITHRMRGTPIDKVVAEMMILANSRWGDMLAEHKVAAIYRAQSSGKTRMTTEPLGHQGLGVAHYTWSSSPLRRYIDLVNQRQLIALVRGETPPYMAKTEELEGTVFAFEQAYEAYNDFQRQMEKYWVMRYFQQEGITEVTGAVIRENLVRLENVPLVVKAIAMPDAAPGTRVKLTLRDMDLLTLELSCPFLSLVPA
jgi:exoribonuclease-2